ncbi:MAG: 3'-5' exonuclease [Methanomethylophilus alvi]|nr:3'-5' exonuclease [Methanomethylophilus alvi]
MIVNVIDTETTGLNGALGGDLVVEIGIVQVDTVKKTVSPFFESIVGAKLTKTQAESWVFQHTDLTPEEVENGPDAHLVADKVRHFLNGTPTTSFNTPFDFGLFLDHRPWNLDVRLLPDIMMAATEDPSIPRRRHNDGNCYASLENSYRVLCPDDPAGLNGPEKHRAMSDAAVAGYVLLALIGKGLYPGEVPE